MTRRDWLLLTLAAALGAEFTPVQLQKVLFLLGDRQKKAVGQKFYRFNPYNYGPFSHEVYRDAEELGELGLARIEPRKPGRSWALYAATPAGIAAANELRPSAPPATIDYLERVVSWARSLSFQQLVSAVYQEYPDQRQNSIFID